MTSSVSLEEAFLPGRRLVTHDVGMGILAVLCLIAGLALNVGLIKKWKE